MNNVIAHFVSRFERLADDEKKDIPLEVVIGGGTASVPGCDEKFASLLKAADLPFNVKNVRMAKNPLYAVSNGCLIKAMSIESKKTTKSSKKENKKEEIVDSPEKTSEINKENAPQKIKLKKS